MININLAPADELESPYWWVPDAIIFVVVLGLSFTGVNYFLGLTKDEIARLNGERDKLQESIANMQPALAKHRDLKRQITDLETKRATLSAITESRIIRYLPIILLENIQNLKPEGVWLSTIRFEDPGAETNNNNNNNNNNNVVQPPQPPAPPAVPGQLAQVAPAAAPGGGRDPFDEQKVDIFIEGFAFDLILVSEFMTALKATKNQEYYDGDLRTHLYFEKVNLEITDTRTLGGANEGQREGQNVEVNRFTLRLEFAERSRAAPVQKDSLIISQLDTSLQRRDYIR